MNDIVDTYLDLAEKEYSKLTEIDSLTRAMCDLAESEEIDSIFKEIKKREALIKELGEIKNKINKNCFGDLLKSGMGLRAIEEMNIRLNVIREKLKADDEKLNGILNSLKDDYKNRICEVKKSKNAVKGYGHLGYNLVSPYFDKKC